MKPLPVYRLAALDLPSHTPRSVLPHFLAVGAYSVGTFWAISRVIVTEMHILKQVFIMFLDGVPTGNRSRVIDQNRILREERGQGVSVIVVPSILKFLSEREKLLALLWIGCVCLLGKDRQSKADCQS